MTTEAIDNKVKSIISNIRNLPTPPIVFHQIQKVINDPNVSADHIASILAEDPAMSVKVLKLTNSAFYGLSREIDSVKQAVVIIGMEAIKNLVLSASVLDMFKGGEFDQEYQEKFWRHSLATAFAARLVARSCKAKGMVDPDAAFSAGLLHDIGKMVICCFLPDDYQRLSHARQVDNDAIDFEVENQTLGYNHAQIGAMLATQWKIPNRLGEAIAYHHRPTMCDSDDLLPFVIYLANYLAKKAFYDKNEGHLVGQLDAAVMEQLGADQAALDELSEKLREEYVKAETFMQMAGIGI